LLDTERVARDDFGFYELWYRTPHADSGTPTLTSRSTVSVCASF
jgi:hypothetical protein